MTIVNDRIGFIFYHVPKTAGTSVRTAIAEAPGSFRPKRLGTKHMLPAEFMASQGWLRRLRYRKYFSFCFVRNPWERFGSAHQYNLEHGSKVLPKDVNDAAKMLADGEEKAVTLRSMIPQISYASGASFVGRFETLDADFAEVCRRVGITVSLPRLNTASNTGLYSKGFTPRTIDILSAYYAEDAAAFDYKPPA